MGIRLRVNAWHSNMADVGLGTGACRLGWLEAVQLNWGVAGSNVGRVTACPAGGGGGFLIVRREARRYSFK
jgi:hypothetical protein